MYGQDVCRDCSGVNHRAVRRRGPSGVDRASLCSIVVGTRPILGLALATNTASLRVFTSQFGDLDGSLERNEADRLMELPVPSRYVHQRLTAGKRIDTSGRSILASHC